MILLWFLLGIAIAYGIARYNESNKLFWTLALTFTLGYAMTVMIQKSMTEEQGNKNITVTYPTQMPIITSGSIVYPLAGDSLSVTEKGKTYVPAGKDTSNIDEIVILRKVAGGVRDQPFVLPRSDNIDTSFYDTS